MWISREISQNPLPWSDPELLSAGYGMRGITTEEKNLEKYGNLSQFEHKRLLYFLNIRRKVILLFMRGR